jgi:hypothetical protein
LEIEAIIKEGEIRTEKIEIESERGKAKNRYYGDVENAKEN